MNDGAPLDTALDVLRAFYAIRDLGDLIYDVREREGLGWEGSKVMAWGKACARAQELLAADKEATR